MGIGCCGESFTTADQGSNTGTTPSSPAFEKKCISAFIRVQTVDISNICEEEEEEEEEEVGGGRCQSILEVVCGSIILTGIVISVLYLSDIIIPYLKPFVLLDFEGIAPIKIIGVMMALTILYIQDRRTKPSSTIKEHVVDPFIISLPQEEEEEEEEEDEADAWIRFYCGNGSPTMMRSCSLPAKLCHDNDEVLKVFGTISSKPSEMRRRRSTNGGETLTQRPPSLENSFPKASETLRYWKENINKIKDSFFKGAIEILLTNFSLEHLHRIQSIWEGSNHHPLPSSWKSQSLYARMVDSRDVCEGRILGVLKEINPAMVSTFFPERVAILQSHFSFPYGSLTFGTIHHFANEYFEGKFILRVRDAKNDDPYFKSKKRLMQCAIQGKFKHRIKVDSLFSGMVDLKPFHCLPNSLLLKFVDKVISTVLPTLKSNFDGASPYILVPLLSSFQRVVVTDPNTTEPPVIHSDDEIKEDISIMLPPSSSSNGKDPSYRRAELSKLKNIKDFYYEPDLIYTFETYQHVFDFESFSLKLPWTSLDINKHLNKNPIQINAFIESEHKSLFINNNDKEEKKKNSIKRRFIWNIEIFNQLQFSTTRES